MTDDQLPIALFTDPRVVYSGDAARLFVAGPGSYQLNYCPFYGASYHAQLEQAASQLRAFVSSAQPEVVVSFPMGRESPAAHGAAGTFWVSLLIWYGSLRQRSPNVQLTLDRTTGIARLRRSYVFFWRTNKARLTDFTGVEVRKPWLPSTPWMVTAWLRFSKQAWPFLPRYASGPAGDGVELAKQVGDWITNRVPTTEQ